MAIRRVTGAVSPSELIFADANALGATYDGSGTTIERGETFTLPAGGSTAVSNGALRLEALKGDCTITNNGNSTLTNASGVDGTIVMRSGASDFPAYVKNSSMSSMSTPAREDFTGDVSGTVSGTINSNATFPAGTVLQIKDSSLRTQFSYTNTASAWYTGTASTRADQSFGGVIDDLSLTLTTKGVNSTFYIILNLVQCSNTDMDGGYNAGGYIYNSIDSYATPIDRGSTVGSRERVTFGNWSDFGSNDYATYDMGCQITHTSSLAKGSSLSYRTVLTTRYTTGGNTVRVGQDNADSNQPWFFTTVSTFRVIEVAT